MAYKRRALTTKEGDRIQTNSARKQGTSKKAGSALQADSFSLGLEVGEREVISPGKDLLVFYLSSPPFQVLCQEHHL